MYYEVSLLCVSYIQRSRFHNRLVAKRAAKDNIQTDSRMQFII
jgi:hypothetical protein